MGSALSLTAHLTHFIEEGKNTIDCFVLSACYPPDIELGTLHVVSDFVTALELRWKPRLRQLSQVTQPVSGRTGIQTRVCLTPTQTSWVWLDLVAAVVPGQVGSSFSASAIQRGDRCGRPTRLPGEEAGTHPG